MSSAEKRPCAGEVYHSVGRWGSYAPCGNAGKVERAGKWYCGIHDPERVSDREARRRARWDAEERERTARRSVAKARDAIADAVESGVTGGPLLVMLGGLRDNLLMARAEAEAAASALDELSPPPNTKV